MHALPRIGQFAKDVVTEIAGNPVSHEFRRNKERRNAPVEIGEFKRLDPVDVIVLAHCLDEVLAYFAPSFIRHYRLTRSVILFL